MEYKLQYYSDVKDGKLQTNVRELIKENLVYFNDKRIEITIKKIKSKRSLKQNNYLHALFTIFAKELTVLTGQQYTMMTIKNMCKLKFALIDVVNQESGEIIGQDIKATSSMNKTELSEFVENIIRYAAEMFKIILPYPNENMKITFD
jgi:hypothetical protein